MEKVIEAHNDMISDYGFGLPIALPSYSNASVGKWTLDCRPPCIGNSYLAETSMEPEHYVLTRGDVVWMSTAMLELESHAWHLHRATGNVVIAGLGMGVYAHAAAAKHDVEQVVVVELDPEIIYLFNKATDFDNSPMKSKIKIVHGDALDPDTRDKVMAILDGERVDYLYADIWPEFPAVEAPAQTFEMVELYRPQEAGWWGQEVEYGLWLESQNKEASVSSLHAFFEAHAIPGVSSTGYVEFCKDAISANFGPLRELTSVPTL